MSEKLKPCPFCEKQHEWTKAYSHYGVVEFIQCGKFIMFEHGITEKVRKDKAIELYNTRPIEDQLRAENDRLKSDAEQNELILLALHEALKEKQEHVQELEQERQWISISNLEKDGIYAYIDYRNGNGVAYFIAINKIRYQRNHIEFLFLLPQPPQEEE